MENATKGLMIAGAILIAIVLIGLGVMLVTQAQGFMDQGTIQFDQMQISAFNSPFESYENKQNGSNIKALITKINANNLTAADEATYAEKGINVLFSIENVTGIDITGNQEGYSAVAATKAKAKINSGKSYYVGFGYAKSGLINNVCIADTEAKLTTLLTSLDGDGE